MKNILTLLIVISLFSCKQSNSTTPAGYIAAVTTANDSIYEKGARVGLAFNKGMFTGDYSSVAAANDDLANWLSKQITFFSQKSDIKSVDSLQAAELAYLRFEEEVVKIHFSKLTAFTRQSTETEIQEVVAGLEPVSERNARFFEQISALQEKFAEMNNVSFTRGAYKNMFK